MNTIATHIFAKAVLSKNGQILSDDEWNEKGYDPYKKDTTTYRMNSKQFYEDH